jgi:hypothetical protein
MTIEEKKEGNITDAVILYIADEITRIKNHEYSPEKERV